MRSTDFSPAVNGFFRRPAAFAEGGSVSARPLLAEAINPRLALARRLAAEGQAEPPLADLVPSAPRFSRQYTPEERALQRLKLQQALKARGYAEGGTVDAEDAAIREAFARRLSRTGRSAAVHDPADRTNVPRGLLDGAAGALRGAVGATLGTPGDLESLARGVRGGFQGEEGFLPGMVAGFAEPTRLYTTEEVLRRLPEAGNLSRAAMYGEELGQFIPIAGLAPLKAAIRAAKLRRAKAAQAAAVSAGLAAEAGAKKVGYAEGGSVDNDDLETALDNAYMNIKFGD